MQFNLENAVKAGLSASFERDKNIEEIDKLIETANLAVLNLTEKKVGFDWRPKSFKMPSILAHLAAPLSDENIEEIGKQERILMVFKTNDRTISHDLAVLTIDPTGFPCEMNINGSKHVAHDIEALAEGFELLLSSVLFGQKLRILME